ncbi:MAG: hypothetical protein WCK07_24200 [Betaproteobacteria bacterium]
MSAVTAVILVGSAHPNVGGNRPFAEINLEEGGRPALVLRWTTPTRKGSSEVFRKFTMIPTIEHMLDDSILMVAYAVCRHSKVFSKVNRVTQDAPLDAHRLIMHDDFTPKQRADLYAAVKEIDNLPKVTWCLFDGTSIKSSMSHLNDYQLECEVTRSVYSRRYTNFTDTWDVKGKLP